MRIRFLWLLALFLTINQSCLNLVKVYFEKYAKVANVDEQNDADDDAPVEWICEVRYGVIESHHSPLYERHSFLLQHSHAPWIIFITGT